MSQLVELVGADRKGFSRKTTRPAHLKANLSILLCCPSNLAHLCRSPPQPKWKSNHFIPWGDWQIKTNQFGVIPLLTCNKNTIFHLSCRSEGPITLIKPSSSLCYYDTPCLDRFKQATRVRQMGRKTESTKSMQGESSNSQSKYRHNTTGNVNDSSETFSIKEPKIVPQGSWICFAVSELIYYFYA